MLGLSIKYGPSCMTLHCKLAASCSDANILEMWMARKIVKIATKTQYIIFEVIIFTIKHLQYNSFNGGPYVQPK